VSTLENCEIGTAIMFYGYRDFKNTVTRKAIIQIVTE
jgi:hypothetical protein